MDAQTLVRTIANMSHYRANDTADWQDAQDALNRLIDEARQTIDTKTRLLDAVAASLTAWGGEEDSVKEEHAETIEELQAAYDAFLATP